MHMRHILNSIFVLPKTANLILNVILTFRGEYKELSIRSMIKLKLGRQELYKVRIYKGTKLDISQSAKLIVNNGTFKFNQKWLKNDPFPSVLVFRENASLIVHKDFQVFSGAKIHINSNATLLLGSGYINSNVNINCYEMIEIGDDVAISENVCIRDSDSHFIIDSIKKNTSPIKIGNHVWIGMNVIILKGVTIGDGAVICAGTLVHRNVKANTMVAGNPQMVVREDVTWK